MSEHDEHEWQADAATGGLVPLHAFPSRWVSMEALFGMIILTKRGRALRA
jgi:hypothetical protein